MGTICGKMSGRESARQVGPRTVLLQAQGHDELKAELDKLQKKAARAEATIAKLTEELSQFNASSHNKDARAANSDASRGFIHGAFTENKTYPGTKLWACRDDAVICERVGTKFNPIETCEKGREVEASGPLFLAECRRVVPILPNGFVLVQVATGFSSSQFPLQRPTPGRWPNRVWPSGIGNPPDFATLDVFIDRLNESHLPLTVGSPATHAMECFMDIKENCETRVLATAKVGKWVTGWGCSIAQYIFSAQLVAATVWLIAKQGGPACAEELVLLQYILERMGFTFVADSWGNCSNRYWDKWTKPRSNALEMTVYVWVNCAVEDIDIQQAVAPVRKFSAAPNLTRMALVSSPADAIDGINEIITLDMDAAKKRTQEKGFRPDENFDESPEAKIAYGRYFDYAV